MKRIHCRACNACGLTEVLHLGLQPPSNALLAKPGPEKTYPLRMVVCRQCHLMQLDYDVPHDELFTGGYPYFSGASAAQVQHAKEYVDMITDRLQLDCNSYVVEIGGNDGTLLKQFVEPRVLNVEISESVAAASEAAGIPVLRTPWGWHFERLPRERADLIIANNVMAHTPDPLGFIDCIKRNLGDHGTFTAEFPWGKNLIDQTQFDTIYHEHYSYFTLTSLLPLFAKCGLCIYHVEHLPVHGGSLRIYASHAGCPQTSAVKEFLLAEAPLNRLETYWKFRERAFSLRGYFESFLSKHAPICAFGAAAKGNTFLNWMKVDSSEILAVGDDTAAKQGRFLPGSHIPIVPEQELLAMRPDYVLILPWNWADAIANKLHCIRAWGGQFVTAIPDLRVF